MRQDIRSYSVDIPFLKYLTTRIYINILYIATCTIPQQEQEIACSITFCVLKAQIDTFPSKWIGLWYNSTATQQGFEDTLTCERSLLHDLWPQQNARANLPKTLCPKRSLFPTLVAVGWPRCVLFSRHIFPQHNAVSGFLCWAIMDPSAWLRSYSLDSSYVPSQTVVEAKTRNGADVSAGESYENARRSSTASSVSEVRRQRLRRSFVL